MVTDANAHRRRYRGPDLFDLLVHRRAKVAGGDNTASEGELNWHVLQLVVELILRLPRGLNELITTARLFILRVQHRGDADSAGHEGNDPQREKGLHNRDPEGPDQHERDGAHELGLTALLAVITHLMRMGQALEGALQLVCLEVLSVSGVSPRGHHGPHAEAVLDNLDELPRRLLTLRILRVVVLESPDQHAVEDISGDGLRASNAGPLGVVLHVVEEVPGHDGDQAVDHGVERVAAAVPSLGLLLLLVLLLDAGLGLRHEGLVTIGLRHLGLHLGFALLGLGLLLLSSLAQIAIASDGTRRNRQVEDDTLTLFQ
mmetsp:Transcript_103277/g.296578  ORF Transcript_103277/g.296578 Transcript_103277/m.296578 type:complete len:316 (+) Transcript_103277:1658-2605(+)